MKKHWRHRVLFVCYLFVVVVVVVSVSLSLILASLHRRKSTSGWQYKNRFFKLNLVIISLYLFASEGAKAFLLNVFVLNIYVVRLHQYKNLQTGTLNRANRANSAGNKEHAGENSYWRINFPLYTYLPSGCAVNQQIRWFLLLVSLLI